jgi:hypothetical protein
MAIDMAFLNTDMKMTNPNENLTFWDNMFALGKVLAPWLTVGWGFHILVNKVFKYFSDSRDAELREIVRKEVQPKLDEMSKKIDHLSGLIFELNNKK